MIPIENGNQFRQIVESFFRLYPMKNQDALFCYVELESSVDAQDFMEWFTWRKR